jgi:hypothetical protein
LGTTVIELPKLGSFFSFELGQAILDQLVLPALSDVSGKIARERDLIVKDNLCPAFGLDDCYVNTTNTSKRRELWWID